mgnify:CR=1 FL=1
MSDHVVRRNRMTFQAQFIPPDGSAVVPAAAHLTLVYKDRSGGLRTDNVELQNSAGVWTGSWDTSNVGSGQRVEWMSWCEGLLQAAVQGSFHVDANKANDAV